MFDKKDMELSINTENVDYALEMVGNALDGYEFLTNDSEANIHKTMQMCYTGNNDIKYIILNHAVDIYGNCLNNQGMVSLWVKKETGGCRLWKVVDIDTLELTDKVKELLNIK